MLRALPFLRIKQTRQHLTFSAAMSDNLPATVNAAVVRLKLEADDGKMQA